MCDCALCVSTVWSSPCGPKHLNGSGMSSAYLAYHPWHGRVASRVDVSL